MSSKIARVSRGTAVPAVFMVETPMHLTRRQQELLQLIQGHRPLISSDGRDVPVSLRVIATSSHDLERKVAAGNFREDLFSTLSVVTLRMPSLRERKEDIPALARYFWRIYSERFGWHLAAPGAQVIDRLLELIEPLVERLDRAFVGAR